VLEIELRMLNKHSKADYMQENEVTTSSQHDAKLSVSGCADGLEVFDEHENELIYECTNCRNVQCWDSACDMCGEEDTIVGLYPHSH